MGNIQQAIEAVNQVYKETLSKDDGGAFNKLSMTLSDLEEGLREYIQEITKPNIVQILQKLHSGQALSPADLAYIRMWIIGDAEYYAQLENNVGDWNNELKRLMAKVTDFKNTNMDFVAASTLRATLLDAMRTVGSIAFFLQQKERVEKFASSTQELDDEERLLLTRLLLSKMESDKY